MNILKSLSVINVSLLCDRSVRAVLKNISFFINDVEKLPVNLRERILNLMTKRGLLTNENIGKVIFYSMITAHFIYPNGISGMSLEAGQKCPPTDMGYFI
jgi:hypothetical protein